jgi:translation initiation factor IF-2
MQFSIPYQVGAALSDQPRGPYWYTAAAEFAGNIAAKTFVIFDDECDAFWKDNHRQMSKVSIATTAGQRYDTRVESDPSPVTPEEFTEKFYEVSSQVIGGDAATEVRRAVIALPTSATVGELVAALVAPTTTATA